MLARLSDRAGDRHSLPGDRHSLPGDRLSLQVVPTRQHLRNPYLCLRMLVDDGEGDHLSLLVVARPRPAPPRLALGPPPAAWPPIAEARAG